MALAGQRVRRKVIFALTLCSVIPLLLLTYAFHAPVREFLGPLVGLADSVSVPAILTFTALLMAGGAFIVWDIATALSRAAQLSNEQSPELPAEPSRKDEIGTLMSSFARMLATIEQQSQEINEFPRRLDQLIREAFRDSLTGAAQPGPLHGPPHPRLDPRGARPAPTSRCSSSISTASRS